MSVQPKTQRNRAVLLKTCFATSWRSGIHVNLKIDADTLNRRRRRFWSAVQYTSIKDSDGNMLAGAHASTVPAMRKIKSKTKQLLLTVLPT